MKFGTALSLMIAAMAPIAQAADEKNNLRGFDPQQLEKPDTNALSREEDSSLNKGSMRQLAPIKATEPVCKNGVFQPDLNKYYKIGAPGSGQFWAQGHPIINERLGNPDYNWTWKPNQPGLRMHLAGKNDIIDHTVTSQLHWRFVKNGNQWYIQNRLSGLKINYDNDSYMTTHLHQPTPFAGQCNADGQVKLKGYGWDSMSPRCDIIGCLSGQYLNMGERQQRVIQEKGCVAYWSCSDLGAGWYQIDSTDYAFCTAYTCERYVTVDSQKDGLYWDIEEVTEYMKPDVENPVVVTVNEHSLATLGNEIALVGGVAFKDTPIVGAIASFLQNEYFSGPTIAEQLQELAEDITAMTDDMISTSLVKFSINDTKNKLQHRWEYFLQTYPKLKHREMRRQDMDQLDDLADDLFVEARGFETDMLTFFGPNFEPNQENIKRAQKGFNYHKLAMVQNLIMYQEAVLLDAYVHPGSTCEEIFSDRGLAQKAKEYNKKLMNIWDMLRNKRMSYVGSSHNSQKYTCEAHDDLNGRTELFYFSGGNAAGVYETARQVENAVKSELTFDMQFFSYPTREQINFFDGYEKKTLDMCTSIRSDPEFREIFETDFQCPSGWAYHGYSDSDSSFECIKFWEYTCQEGCANESCNGYGGIWIEDRDYTYHPYACKFQN